MQMSSSFELHLADETTPFGVLTLEELIRDRKENGKLKYCIPNGTGWQTVLYVSQYKFMQKTIAQFK